MNKIKNPMKPPKKITLSRKSKDEQGLESIKGGGEYKVRSRDKVANPVNPSKTLSRGSVVSVKPKTEVVKTPVEPTTTYKSTTIDVPKSKFVPGDYQNKAVDRTTTMLLGKKLNEDPNKTKARISAQNRGETSYISSNGNREYSGRIDQSYDKKKIQFPVTTKPSFKSETISKDIVSVKTPVAASSVPKHGGDTKRKHAEWLDRKGENKAFTSKPNTGKKTKIKWTGSKVKRY